MLSNAPGNCKLLILPLIVQLPEPRVIINDLQFAKILQTFQNLSFIGEMRQRWEEIKKLQSKPNMAV